MSKLPIPIKDIVALIEYLGPSDERDHMEDMRRDGEDISHHIFTSIKAVTDWLDDRGIAYRDHNAELRKQIANAFAAQGVKVSD